MTHKSKPCCLMCWTRDTKSMTQSTRRRKTGESSNMAYRWITKIKSVLVEDTLSFSLPAAISSWATIFRCMNSYAHSDVTECASKAAVTLLLSCTQRKLCSVSSQNISLLSFKNDCFLELFPPNTAWDAWRQSIRKPKRIPFGTTCTSTFDITQCSSTL